MDRQSPAWAHAPHGTRNPTWLHECYAATWLDGARPERLFRIVTVMQHARAAGVACASPVFAKPSQGGCWLICERLPGSPAARVDADRLATLLAQIHRAPASTVASAEIGSWPELYRDQGSGSIQSDLVFGHFDLFADNIICQGDTVTGIVDWEFAGLGPRVLDVAIAALGLSNGQPDRARADLANLALAYEVESGLSLDRYGLDAAYRYAARLFAERRVAAGSPRPADELLACANALELSAQDG